MSKINPNIKKAKTIPSEFYYSEKKFQEIKELLFAKQWQFICDTTKLQNHGDAFPYSFIEDFIEDPLILVNDNGEIKSMSNVCTHRGNILIEESCNIKRGIIEYEDRKNSINDLQYKFKNGLEAEGGKKVIEDIYLVNNPNNFYLTGSVLAAFIVAPLITDILEIFDWFSGEEEESDDPFYDADEEEESRNKRDKNIKKLGRYTFLPGVSIIAIGYFGSKIKIAQKEKIINDDDLVMPNLLEFFKKNEINMAIKIYNNRIKI